MSTAALVPVEEYLYRSYSPDVDYDEGVLIERNVGKRKHSRLQALLAHYLGSRETEWGIKSYVEQRIRVAPRRFCVADVCATLATAGDEDIFTEPPLFTIEILSDSDVFSDVEAKAQKYIAMGIPNVWTIDPETGLAWRHDAQHSMSIVPESILRVANTPIEIPAGDLARKI